MSLTVLYRISNGSYKKNRLPHATKEHCLMNFIYNFMSPCGLADKLVVLMDNCDQDTEDMIYRILPMESKNPAWCTVKIHGGSSAQSFNRALDYVMNMGLSESDIVYFMEDDYLHLPGSRRILDEGLSRAHYVSLYDHPDKYINANDGGNPHVEDGGEITRVLRTESCHWKLTNSTTMSFATSFSVLAADEPIWRKYTGGMYPQDFQAFEQLRHIGRTLITPIPGYSTHTEVLWLTPYVDWSKV